MAWECCEDIFIHIYKALGYYHENAMDIPLRKLVILWCRR